VSSSQKDIIENARILIVDDQYTNISLMERILKAGGYRHIAGITEPRQVIDQFRIFQPDLVVLDLAMPRVDGFGVMAQLRGWIAEDTYLPILVLTSDVSHSARQKALSLGANDFLTKPVDGTEILLRIYNLLQIQWLYRQTQAQNQRLREQVRASQHELQKAKGEIEQLAGAHGIPADLLAALRAQVMQAVNTIDRLAESAGRPVTAPSPELPDAASALPEECVR